MTGRLTNWAGNITYGAARLHRPGSVEQLQELVAGSGSAPGARHRATPSTTSPTRPAAISSRWRGCRPQWSSTPSAGTVTVGGGVRYGELAARLHGAGLRAAQPRLAAAHLGRRRLRHGHARLGRPQRQPGHGGRRRWSWSPPTARSSSLSRERDGDGFAGAVVGLGALGVVTGLTLDIVPAFDVRQYVYEDLPLGAAGRALRRDPRGRRTASACSPTGPARGSTRCGSSAASTSRARGRRRRAGWGAPRPTADRHPVPGMSAVNCTEQLGVPGPVARAAAALPAGVHPQQRRGAAVGVLGAAPPRARGAPRVDAHPGPRSRPSCRSRRSAPSPPTSCG